MTRLRILVLSAFASIAGISSTSAHHSFAAQYDREQMVEFTGVVTNVEWTNPHARFYVDGPDPDLGNDEVIHWNIELVSANVLMRQGWKRDSLKVGDTVTVAATRARKDPHVVNASSVIDANGDRLFSRGPNASDNQ